MFRIYFVLLLSLLCSPVSYAADGGPDELVSSRRVARLVEKHTEELKEACGDVLDPFVEELRFCREKISALLALPGAVPAQEERPYPTEALEVVFATIGRLEDMATKDKAYLTKVGEGLKEWVPSLLADVREMEKTNPSMTAVAREMMEEPRAKQTVKCRKSDTSDDDGPMVQFRLAFARTDVRERPLRAELCPEDHAALYSLPYDTRVIGLRILDTIDTNVISLVRFLARECHGQPRSAGDAGASSGGGAAASSCSVPPPPAPLPAPDIAVPEAPFDVAPDMCTALDRILLLERAEKVKRAPGPIEGSFHLAFRFGKDKVDEDFYDCLEVILSERDKEVLTMAISGMLWGPGELEESFRGIRRGISYLLRLPELYLDYQIGDKVALGPAATALSQMVLRR